MSHSVPARDPRRAGVTFLARPLTRNPTLFSRPAVSHRHGTRSASDIAMRISYRAGLGVGAIVLCACSGGRVGDRGTAASDASADRSPGAASCGPGPTVAPRAPSSHRASGSVCPSARGPVSPDASLCTAPADSGLCTCATDSDCTGGPNGRCTRNIPTPGAPASADYGEGTSCSYDECFRDSQCDDGGAACTCRASGILTEANVCLPAGNCAVDSDCGPGGYCSPSALEGCSCWGPCASDDGGGCSESTGGGPPVAIPCVCSIPCSGYFCHTRCDQCVEDSDCQTGHCSYDTTSGRWECLQPACPL